MSQEQLAARFLSIGSGISSLDLREGNIQEEQYNVLRQKANNISDIFLLMMVLDCIYLNSLELKD